eukprot:m.9861 g.9861  ORF g.9861 m.9861 type:complete len:290 (-) comp4153_c0_seq1:121-990(-)
MTVGAAIELTKVSIELAKILIEVGSKAYEAYKERKKLKASQVNESLAAKQYAAALASLKPVQPSTGDPPRMAGVMNLKEIGQYYEGEFIDGDLDGPGIMKLGKKNPSVYVGNFVEGRPHGEGKMEYGDDSQVTYVGNWEYGERHGYGQLTTKKGSVYAGIFEHNQFVSGRIITPKGISFEGEAAEFMPVKGRIEYPSGIVYEGEIKDWKWHGKGIIKFPKKNKQTGKPYKATQYSGSFEACTYHGEGEMQWVNKKTWTGTWNQNEMVKESGVWGTVSDAPADKKTGDDV